MLKFFWLLKLLKHPCLITSAFLFFAVSLWCFDKASTIVTKKNRGRTRVPSLNIPVKNRGPHCFFPLIRLFVAVRSLGGCLKTGREQRKDMFILRFARLNAVFCRLYLRSEENVKAPNDKAQEEVYEPRLGDRIKIKVSLARLPRKNSKQSDLFR